MRQKSILKKSLQPAKHPLSPFTLPFRRLTHKEAVAPQDGHLTLAKLPPFIFAGISTSFPQTVHDLLGIFPSFYFNDVNPYKVRKGLKKNHFRLLKLKG